LNLQKLQDSIRGEITSDAQILNYYSVDSSFYRVKPKLVVFPKTISDIVATVRFAKKNKLTVTPRGAGTGLVGSALNDRIIMDLKNFDKIRVYKNFVDAGAGVHKGKLDLVLKKHKKFLGPNPSVGPYCTIGGMVATNASGSRSLKYGSTLENLLGVTIVLGMGKVAKLPSDSLSNSVLALANSIDRGSYPQVSKNSCGYRLDAIRDKSDSHKIIAGSEGTLGIITSVRLKIFDEPQKRALLILGYQSTKDALQDCQNIVKLGPSALEFVDSNTAKNFQARIDANCVLYIEFDSKIHQNIQSLKKISSGKTLYTFFSDKSMTKWWAYRSAALHFSLKNLSKREFTSHIIEDATVPLKRLGDLITLAEKIQKKFHARLVMYGHAGNGNIHIRLATRDRTAIRKLARMFFVDVIKMGGTITGEHGDGIARTDFVRLQYGKKTYDAFMDLKKRFDPDMVLNPGKIVKLARTH
jgi:FAD/FMN-containing dehydrogenase